MNEETKAKENVPTNTNHDRIKSVSIIDSLDFEAKDIVIDDKFKIHIKRNDVGYSIDIIADDGACQSILDELTIWDEDLEMRGNANGNV